VRCAGLQKEDEEGDQRIRKTQEPPATTETDTPG
jgi:hypothetical protein